MINPTTQELKAEIQLANDAIKKIVEEFNEKTGVWIYDIQVVTRESQSPVSNEPIFIRVDCIINLTA